MPVHNLDDQRATSDLRAWCRGLAKRYPELTSASLHVAKELQLYANADCRCFPGHARIAEETRLSVRSVTTAIKQLRSVGAIAVDRDGNGHDEAVYVLGVDRAISTLGGNAASTLGGSPRARGVGRRSREEDQGKSRRAPAHSSIHAQALDAGIRE